MGKGCVCGQKEYGNLVKRFEVFYPPTQKTMGVSPWMNAQGGPSEAWRAKEGASADCAEEMKDNGRKPVEASYSWQ